MKVRTKPMTIMLTPDEHAMCQKIAETERVTKSSIIRRLLYTHAEDLGIATPARPKHVRNMNRDHLWPVVHDWIYARYAKAPIGTTICTSRDIVQGLSIAPSTANKYMRQFYDRFPLTEIVRESSDGRLGQPPYALRRLARHRDKKKP